MNALDRLQIANREAGLHWFSPPTMRFFRTRLPRKPVHFTGRMVVFVTSELAPSEKLRRYTIRLGDLETGRVETVGDFQAYLTRDLARRAARDMIACGLLSRVTD